MKVVRVKLTLDTPGGSWTQYFSDYPSLETLRLRLRGMQGRGRLNIPDFVRRLSSEGWKLLENPDRWVQSVSVCGVCIGTAEMRACNVYELDDQQIVTTTGA